MKTVTLCSLASILIWSMAAQAGGPQVGEPLKLNPTKPDTSIAKACKESIHFPTRKAKNPAPGAETNLPPPLFEAMRDCPVDKRYHPRPMIKSDKKDDKPVLIQRNRKVEFKNPQPPIIVNIPVIPVPDINIPKIEFAFDQVIIDVSHRVDVSHDFLVDPIDVALHVPTPVLGAVNINPVDPIMVDGIDPVIVVQGHIGPISPVNVALHVALADLATGSMGPVGPIVVDPLKTVITVPGHIDPVTPVGADIVIGKISNINKIGPVSAVSPTLHNIASNIALGSLGPVGPAMCKDCATNGPGLNLHVGPVVGPQPNIHLNHFVGIKPLALPINVFGPGPMSSPNSQYKVNFYKFIDPGLSVGPVLLGN